MSSDDADLTPDPLLLAGIDRQRGLRMLDADRTAQGFVLFSPMISGNSYLINRAGQVVHLWETDYAPGAETLLDDGHLLRGARVPDAPRFNGGGQSGRIEKLSWAGELVWSFQLADRDFLLHHDFTPLPNGNILAIVWENIPPDVARAAGRQAELLPEAGLWPDRLIEIEPFLGDGSDGGDGGRIVWQWRTWDHLVQNVDPRLPNYGEPADHPGRVDVNSGSPPDEISETELANLKATNLIPGSATTTDRGSDFHHANGIDYHAGLDQIVLSVRALSEIWIIDHGIDSETARGPAGDLLYRWGNPATYGRDAALPVGLGHQHDIRWVPDGYPGAGNLMAFSNDALGADPPRSEVVEFSPPLGTDNRYQLGPDVPYGPQQLAWSYRSPDTYAQFISSARRLQNGNTLINYGPQGRFVEVAAEGDVVWEYWSPYSGAVRMPDGSWPQPGAPFFYSVFRATFIPADHPALAGKELQPLQPQPPASVLPEVELAPFRVAD